jgi:Asp/Glu/hydantoin racemase
MVVTARRLIDENPPIGAIVLECANMAPYAKAVQEAVKLPVFDITTLVNYIYQTIFRERFF